MGGLVGGFIGGAAMAVFVSVVLGVEGRDSVAGLKLLAYPILGEAVRVPGFQAGPVILGVLLHFIVAIGWGLAFGLLAYGLPKRIAVLAGAPWGIVVWLVMFYVVLPVLGGSAVRDILSLPMMIVAHVVYGVTAGLAFIPFHGLAHPLDRVTEARPHTNVGH